MRRIPCSGFRTRVPTCQGEGQHVDGLAIDWSRCYDHMPPESVHELLRSAGVPDHISGPILFLYRAPRRIVADGACGSEQTPTHCIPAGCPIATLILALATFGWRKETAVSCPAARSRAYVDDMTAHCRRESHITPHAGATQARNLGQVTQAFFTTFRLVANLIKSAFFSSCRYTRALLGQSGQFQPSRAFVDLGVDQSLTPQPAFEKRAERTTAVVLRSARIGQLPFPLSHKSRLMAASP